MTENREVMGRNILRYMEEKGVIAADVCRDLNFKPNTFSDWCHGKTYPRIDAIEKMANYFGIPKSFLVEDIKPLDTYVSPKEKWLIDAIRNTDETTLEMIKRLLAYKEGFDDIQEKKAGA
jgi:transcriptional regulator with XRE-family HTH domain